MTAFTFAELHLARLTLREASEQPVTRYSLSKPCWSSAAALRQTIAQLNRSLSPGLVVLAVSIGLAGCRKAVPIDAEIQNVPTPAAAPGAVVMASSGAVTLEVGDQRVQVTVADGRAIKAALLARLRASSVDDRDYLIRATEQVEPAIDGGVLRIGIWILESDGARMRISYRMPAGPEGAQAYRAEVTKSGQSWDVKEIVAGHIRARH
jgi:hypothetical protein